MTMDHDAAMRGKARAADSKDMHKKGSHMSHDGITDRSRKPGRKLANMGPTRNMTGMDMSQGQAAANAPSPGRLPTGDGAALKGYDAYGAALRIDDDPLLANAQLDNLEGTHNSDGASGLLWDGRFWVGHNLDMLWLRSEGSRSKGRIEEGMSKRCGDTRSVRSGT